MIKQHSLYPRKTLEVKPGTWIGRRSRELGSGHKLGRKKAAGDHAYWLVYLQSSMQAMVAIFTIHEDWRRKFDTGVRDWDPENLDKSRQGTYISARARMHTASSFK